MPTRRAVSTVCVALGCIVAAATARANYVVNPLDLPGAVSTDIWDISNTGQLVGTAYDGTNQFGYVYDAGTVTRLYGPTGATGANAMGISDNTGAVVGAYYDSTSGSHGFIYQSGTYTTIDVPFAGATYTDLRSISPDGRYIAGTYASTSGVTNSFVLDRNSGSFTPVGDSSFSIAQGINSAAQLVGSVSGGQQSYIHDLNTGATTYFSFSGASQTAARAINDNGQISGWLVTTAGEQRAWIGTPSGYQTIGVPGAYSTIGEGLNNLGQVAGFWYASDTDEYTHGFVATPATAPASVAGGVYTFSSAVVADVPIFIDPAVAIGYEYRIGKGNPLFKTVSLPVGIGDNEYFIIVGGKSFEVAGNQIFDFTAHGYAAGVDDFTVTGIEASAGLDPNDPTAFVTRLTFTADGMFTGTQTALAVPEPQTVALLLLGLATIGMRRNRSHGAS